MLAEFYAPGSHAELIATGYAMSSWLLMPGSPLGDLIVICCNDPGEPWRPPWAPSWLRPRALCCCPERPGDVLQGAAA